MACRAIAGFGSYRVKLPSPATDDWHSMRVHDVEQLVSDVQGPLQVFLLHKVLLAPLHRHLIPLPLLENVEQSQVVALKNGAS